MFPRRGAASCWSRSCEPYFLTAAAFCCFCSGSCRWLLVAYYALILFLALYCYSNLVIRRFSMLLKCECYSPVSCSSSCGQAGFMLHCLLAAEVIEHAIRYWLVLTSLWSCKLNKTKNSVYFSIRLTHLSSWTGLEKCWSLVNNMPCAMKISMTSKKDGKPSISKPISLRICTSWETSSFFLLLKPCTSSLPVSNPRLC